MPGRQKLFATKKTKEKHCRINAALWYNKICKIDNSVLNIYKCRLVETVTKGSNTRWTYDHLLLINSLMMAPWWQKV